MCIRDRVYISPELPEIEGHKIRVDQDTQKADNLPKVQCMICAYIFSFPDLY